MKIAISGSTGFIGKCLVETFTSRGMTVIPLLHYMFLSSSSTALKKALCGCDMVINLAGTTINCRWNKTNKERILQSRVDTTRKLVNAINAMEIKPYLFISVSAVGIYPSYGIYTEKNIDRDEGFLGAVCHRWENEAKKVAPGIRLVISRLGVVLGSEGGALPKMLKPFRYYVGGKISSGKQGFSWIHIEDLVCAMLFIMHNPELSGIVNLVAPQPITNKEFAAEAAHSLHRPNWLTIPALFFRILYGEGHVVVTSGQHVFPLRLLTSGYDFRYPTIKKALSSLV
ncbi:TIGR01777 family oxidoreductase [Parabacteroides pacaensis]|uniref:TIGR01777 family oxidoreductase n=1 Tax=Parabacteroides pacaensis TaxID=2086575 RepID=UPI000D0ED9C8|nr:TIGR01777 family oxidoreductase [Parabacteroides pacaensis]